MHLFFVVGCSIFLCFHHCSSFVSGKTQTFFKTTGKGQSCCIETIITRNKRVILNNISEHHSPMFLEAGLSNPFQTERVVFIAICRSSSHINTQFLTFCEPNDFTNSCHHVITVVCSFSGSCVVPSILNSVEHACPLLVTLASTR